MKSLFILLSIILLEGCGRTKVIADDFGLVAEQRKQDLLRELETSKLIASELTEAIVITTGYRAHSEVSYIFKSSFFEKEGETSRYCSDVKDYIVNSSGDREAVMDEERTFSITENIEEELGHIVSLESIYQDCLTTIRDTDFSEISGDDVKPRIGIKHFAFQTNDQGIVIQCGVIDYNLIAADGLGPIAYTIHKMSDVDLEEEEICVE